MIKGIYLRQLGEMSKVSDFDILKNLDPLLQTEEPEVFSGVLYTMTRRSIYSKDYNITTFTADSKVSIDAMYNIYKIIEMADPNLIKVFYYTEDSIVVACPMFKGFIENTNYSTVIDELVRVSAFCLKMTGNVGKSVDLLKDYMELCINKNNQEQNED